MTTDADVTPDVVLEIDFANPKDDPVWEDRTERLRSFEFSRGRDNRDDPMEAGVGTIVLDNYDGEFSPTNDAGPHYPNVLPMRRVRLVAQISMGYEPFLVGGSYVGGTDVLGGGIVRVPLFSGFVEAWPQAWPLNGLDSMVPLRIVDGFKVLSLADFIWGEAYTGLDPDVTWICGPPIFANVGPDVGPPFIPDDLAGTRIERILDCLDWPEADRDLDPGTRTILGSAQIFGGTDNIKVSSGSGLSHAQDVAQTEVGAFFVNASGQMVFRDFNYAGEYDSDAVWSTQTGDRIYGNIGVQYDESRIVNDLALTWTEQAGITYASDATSIDRYYPRSRTITLLPNDVDITVEAPLRLADLAEPELVVQDFRPLYRYSSQNLLEATDWRYILSRDLLDRIRVQERPSRSGEVMDMECRIEGIAISSPSRRKWEVTWQMSVR